MRRARKELPEQIVRARWHLWTSAFVIIAALAVAVVYVSTASGEPGSIPLPSERIRTALAALLAAFVMYVIDRERHLRRLAERLTDERVESARLATRLQYLTELTRERDTNAALLDGSADGVAVVDRELRLRRFNGAMQALCGVPASQALGAAAPEILRFASPDGSPLPGSSHPLRAALDDGSPRAGIELNLLLPGGGQRWVSGTFSPIRDPEGGAPLFALAVLRDISSQKEMEAMQRDFVSIVSHELRSPLTAIKGFAKTLLQRSEELSPSTRREFLETVNSQADRLAHLVDDLLQVSRIDARRLRVDCATLDLKLHLQDLLDQFRTKWTRPIILDVGEDVDDVQADRSKLDEILINLIDNAIKYSNQGDIRIVARATGAEVEVSVEDQGIGIAPEDAAKLFQKFQRISTPATRDVGGTGLGLYIVKGLVEAQGGRVWVASAPGAGSSFTFSLPAARRRIERVGA